MTAAIVIVTNGTAPAEREYTAVLGPQGRLVIPVEIRKQLGLEPGSALNIWEESGVIHLSTRATARAAARKLFRDARGQVGAHVVDELIAERHAEATRDLADEA